MTNEMTQPANDVSELFQAMRDYILQWDVMTFEESRRMTGGEIQERYTFLKDLERKV